MDADWDLHAVVRGCCSAASSSATTASTAADVLTAPVDGYSQQKSTLYGEDNIGVLTFVPDLLKQPPPPPHSQSFQISPFSFLGGLQDPPYNPFNHHWQSQLDRQFQVKRESLGVSRCTTTHAQGTTKIKKRKNQIKRVCQVPAEGSSPDLWSWRKYGQKPIKGSPYPRGYYKCSTLKGCSARKQVERNRSDPGMLIITYTGEHTHPVPSNLNSLAGSTRNKTTAIIGDDNNGNKTADSSPISPVTSLPQKMDEIDTDDDNNYDTSSLVIDHEDTFDGLDELVGPPIGNMFSDHHHGCQITWPLQPPPLPAGVDF